MWPLPIEKEDLDKIINKAGMNPIVKIERCSTTIQNDVDEKPPKANTMQNDADEKPPKANTMQNKDEKPPNVNIKRFPTNVMANVETMRDESHKQAEKLNNDTSKIKVEHKQDLIKSKVSFQKKETNNNIAIVKRTPSTTNFKECPALENCPNLQRLLSGSSGAAEGLVSSVQTGGLGSSISTAGSSVSLAGSSVSPAASSVSPAASSVSLAVSSVSPAASSVSTAGSSISTAGLGSSATGSHFKVDTTFSFGKEVKKESGEGRDLGLYSKRHTEIKKSKEGEDVIILPAMKKEDETVQEVSQSTMNEDPFVLGGGYKDSLNQNGNESSWKAGDQTFPHSKGLRKIDKINLPSDSVKSRVVSRIRGGLKRNPSTIKVQGQKRINEAMYKKHLHQSTGRLMVNQSTGRLMVHQSTGRGMVDQSTGRGMVHQSTGRVVVDQSTGRGMGRQFTGRGMVDQSTGRGIGHQFTGRGMVHQSTGRGMIDQSTGRGMGHQSTGRGMVDQSTGRGIGHQFTGRGMVDQSDGRGVAEVLITERGMVKGLSTARGMVYPPTGMGMVGGLSIGTGLEDPGLFVGQEMVDPPTRKGSFVSNKTNVGQKRLPTGSGLDMTEPEMEASKRFMLAPGNSRGVPRKRSVGRMITPMSRVGLPRMRGGKRKSLPAFNGQGNIGTTNGENLMTSNAGHQRISRINDISSLAEGASSKTQTFNLKQEVIEVVNLSDEDSSPDDGPFIFPNNSSTPVSHISPDVCVSIPALAKLTNCDVSVARSQKKPQQQEKPQQLEMPPGFKLPPGISITRMPSNHTSSSDQKNLSTPERIVKVLSETANRDIGPKKKVQLNLSDSQINVMKELSLL